MVNTLLIGWHVLWKSAATVCRQLRSLKLTNVFYIHEENYMINFHHIDGLVQDC